MSALLLALAVGLSPAHADSPLDIELFDDKGRLLRTVQLPEACPAEFGEVGIFGVDDRAVRVEASCTDGGFTRVALTIVRTLPHWESAHMTGAFVGGETPVTEWEMPLRDGPRVGKHPAARVRVSLGHWDDK
ncbi:MAG: hypothetical protein H6742_14120 [Alphaproteobacteria bacterium]|nr:hypothetical protein [Alphaproteobacteria bacterium]